MALDQKRPGDWTLFTGLSGKEARVGRRLGPARLCNNSQSPPNNVLDPAVLMDLGES